MNDIVETTGIDRRLVQYENLREIVMRCSVPNDAFLLNAVTVISTACRKW